MFDQSDCELLFESAPTNDPKNWLISMSHHLVRSLLVRAKGDLSLLVVVHNKAAQNAILDVIDRMNSMSCDHSFKDVFIAKCRSDSAKKTVVLADSQDHRLFARALESGNDTRPTIIIVQSEFQVGSVLSELAKKRSAECFYLI